MVKNNIIKPFDKHWHKCEKYWGTCWDVKCYSAIKLSDTDNVVVVGTDVNLLILFSKLSHHNDAHLCKPWAGDIYRIIQLSQRLPKCQHFNSKKTTFKLVHRHPELEHKPIGIFQYVLFVNNPATKSGYCLRCIFDLFGNKYSSCQITMLLTSMRLWLELHWWKTATSSHVEASCSTWTTITFSLIRCELGPRESIRWRRYINSEAAQICDQYIDEGDYSSIIIMQDDGIHAIHVIFVQFPHS